MRNSDRPWRCHCSWFEPQHRGSDGVELALQRPHSRRDEFEADRRGLQILGRAGAQSAMISFMEKLLGSRSLPTF